LAQLREERVGVQKTSMQILASIDSLVVLPSSYSLCASFFHLPAVCLPGVFRLSALCLPSIMSILVSIDPLVIHASRMMEMK
jgi:hypothetical protein